MISYRDIANQPAGEPLVADDMVEFHAARLLLLLLICGDKKGRIDSLTKMAKLDFFTRYPKFFERAAEELGNPVEIRDPQENVESTMIRLHYGPWDPRYYQVLSFLEARALISSSKFGKAYHFVLTPEGIAIAEKLSSEPSFASLIEQMKAVNQVLGSKSGTQLKDLIYRLFDKEVAQRSLGEVID